MFKCRNLIKEHIIHYRNVADLDVWKKQQIFMYRSSKTGALMGLAGRQQQLHCKMPRVIVFYSGNDSLYKFQKNEKVPGKIMLKKIIDVDTITHTGTLQLYIHTKLKMWSSQRVRSRAQLLYGSMRLTPYSIVTYTYIM